MRTTLLVLAMLGCAHGEETVELVLTDFGSRKLSWTTVNDNVMGGRSKGGFEVENGVLLFRGSTNTNGGGFSSIRSRPQELDMEGRAAIRLRVRGDGRTYTFRLNTPGSRASYWADFETIKGEWTEVRLPFDSFVPRWRGRRLDMDTPDPARVTGLGLMIYDKRDGPFRLEVDWIRAEAPFSLEPLKWKKRPLVVFATRSDDARLSKQLEDYRAARGGGDVRDMSLVVVAPGLGLSLAEVQALRRQLGVEDESFAVCLVGKDGTVKRRSAEPVLMVDLFGRIDRMPMRQAEKEEGPGK